MKELEDQMHAATRRRRHGVSDAAVARGRRARRREGRGGKKVYEITDAGRKFLDEHRDMVDDIFDRVREAVDRTLGGAMAT